MYVSAGTGALGFLFRIAVAISRSNNLRYCSPNGWSFLKQANKILKRELVSVGKTLNTCLRTCSEVTLKYLMQKITPKSVQPFHTLSVISWLVKIGN